MVEPSSNIKRSVFMAPDGKIVEMINKGAGWQAVNGLNPSFNVGMPTTQITQTVNIDEVDTPISQPKVESIIAQPTVESIIAQPSVDPIVIKPAQI